MQIVIVWAMVEVYDRYLKDFNAPTIGLAYSFQYIEHYQSEDFDIPLDDIITDKKI